MIALGCLTQTTAAQSATKIAPPDGAAGDQFGVSIAQSGSTLLVGANTHDAAAEDAGAVYFYEQLGGEWTFAQKVTPPEGAVADGFGFALDIEGNVAVIGALGDDEQADNAGAVYVYVRSNDGWQFLQKLTADDAAANDAFGYAIALTTPYLIIGARGADDLGNSSGAAYIFQQSDGLWFQLPKLTAGDGTSGDFFGTAVDINSRFAVVGAALADGDVAGSGAVYVFENRGVLWLPYAKLQASDGAFLDQFGAAVSLGDAHILVGARAHDTQAVDAGAAYLFRGENRSFVEIEKLQAADASANSFFGDAVKVSRSETLFALVGAPGNDAVGTEAGAGYVFELLGESWEQAGQLLPSDNLSGSEMGNAIDVAGSHAFVGSWRDGSNGIDTGTVSVFDLQSVLTSTSPLLPTQTHAVSLRAPYPNPFYEAVVFAGELESVAGLSASIYDVRGRSVVNLLSEATQPAGYFEVSWDGRDDAGRHQPAGLYFLVLTTADTRSVSPVIKAY